MIMSPVCRNERDGCLSHLWQESGAPPGFGKPEVHTSFVRQTYYGSEGQGLSSMVTGGGMEMRALEHKANYMSPNCLMRLKRQSGKKHSKRKVLNKKINCPKSKKKG